MIKPYRDSAVLGLSFALASCLSDDSTVLAPTDGAATRESATAGADPSAADAVITPAGGSGIGQLQTAISYSTLLTTTCNNTSAGRVYYVDQVSPAQSPDLVGYYFCKPGSGRSGWVKLPGPGATGPAGPSGATGPSGARGDNGSAGPTGPVGPAGPTGMRGATGASGTDGAPGARGPTGPQGDTGPQGIAGPRGPTGTSGSDGKSGVDGATGAPGATGAMGAPGPTGSTGPAGAAGMEFPPLIRLSAEPPGPHCAQGGTAISVGWDVDGDGEFDAGEATSTAYQCAEQPCPGAGCPGPVGATCKTDADCVSNACCAGLCRDLSSDVSNCGACAVVCSASPHALGSCAAGSCRPSCLPDHADCDGNAANGCEIDLTQADNVCSSALDLGTPGRDPIIHTGNRSTWLEVQLPPMCSAASCPAPLHAAFRLTSPAHIHYDLFAYSSCGAFLTASQSGGSPEWISMGLGSVSASVYLEVRRASGSSCEPWSLSAALTDTTP